MIKICLAVPGKVVEIKEDVAIVDYSGEKREANCSLVDVKVGDYVIVQAKFVVGKLSEQEAKESVL